MSYFKRALEFKDEIQKDKNTFGVKGWRTGISSVDENLSYVKSFSTIVFSYAHHGKTQWVIDNIIFLAREYGVKSAVYLTEAGKVSQAILDIMGTLVGKPVYNITDEEFVLGLEFINKYIYFADISEKLANIDEIYQGVEELKKSGVNIENVVVDHFHQLENSPEQKYMDRADKTKYVLRVINKKSRDLDVHTFIMFHVRDTSPVQCPSSKKWYLPLAGKEDISGGQQASYLGFNMVSIWRPIINPDNYGIINPHTGIPYEVNETIVHVAKVKPKGSAKLSSTSIYFDSERQRYYCIDNGVKKYAVDTLSKKNKDSVNVTAIQPNLNFGKDEGLDNPF